MPYLYEESYSNSRRFLKPAICKLEEPPGIADVTFPQPFVFALIGPVVLSKYIERRLPRAKILLSL
jgi:hypothetical protein